MPYIEAVLKHPFMQDWIAAAQEEEWVIEKFEQPETDLEPAAVLAPLLADASA